MLVTPSEMVTDVKLLQDANAALPMLVTEDGMMTDVKSLHSQKVVSPMAVTLYVTPSCWTLAGMVTEPVYRLSPEVTSTSSVPAKTL